ncbi:oxidoreductase, short chain dehydrogenase/reductase family protein [Cardiosporidium cionae]|uniref:Oxidoreductase, short chain dehydrogenase/reductase family protein n=1 Tax=Cardiosporidium cionae TaxID=476202 RepID=A0ABQ7J774_9APIC|nr:oxidoreductase, short chain dehydrogenase/reductase family protein [Cardiosporidium cionae]|eukprot:KAF8819779.1 oxidoreductase, short chain dehydrogenase/reductase family protein [Cardiosporidium cionae]
MEDDKEQTLRTRPPPQNEVGNASLYVREPLIQGLTFFAVSLSCVLYEVMGSHSFLLSKLKKIPVGAAVLFVYSGRALWSFLLRKIAEGRTLQMELKENTDLTGKFIVLTGGTSGIGKACAIQLVQWGATVIIGCRDIEKGTRALAEIANASGNENSSKLLSVYPLDLSELASVKKFAEQVLSLNVGINFLINNAGVMLPGGQVELSKDGYEQQFATNHLSHFLLTLLLLNNVKKNNGRIITLASLAHSSVDSKKVSTNSSHYEMFAYQCVIFSCKSVVRTLFDFDSVVEPLARNTNQTFKYYSISKLCNIWFTAELQRRLSLDSSTTATAYCCHPGVVRTDLFRDRGKFLAVLFKIVGHFFLKSAESGAATQLHLCAAPLESLYPGLYYDNCRPGLVTRAAVNPLKEQELWKLSERLVANYL